VSREPDFDPTGDPLLAALSEAARLTAIDEAGPGPTPAVWHRLQAARWRPMRWRAVRLSFVAAGLAAAVGAVVVVGVARRQRPLTYAIAQGAAEPAAEQYGKDDGYIRGVGKTGTEVRFSDGTRIAVAEGGRLSVLARASDGARLRVEDGEAHFEVVHRPKAAWTVEAGPFVVYVTGTSFDVRWSGSEETVEVRLRSGSVRVGGPFLPERVTLRPGQRLTARLASGELRIDGGRPEGAAAAVSATGPARSEPASPASGAAVAESGAAPVPSAAEAATRPEKDDEAVEADEVAPAPEGVASAPARASGGLQRLAMPPQRLAMPHRSRARALAAAGKEARAFNSGAWAFEVASGGGATVLAEAEAHGIDRSLAEVDGNALAALADAARYGGRRELAVRALLAERGRFPGSAAAQTAAFQLGRLADDRGDANAALDWYRRYLGEAPRGPYAAEALGREMLTVETLSGRAAARDIAAEYVRRFPYGGTYLLQAHSILSNP
jgi:hypothetical protein